MPVKSRDGLLSKYYSRFRNPGVPIGTPSHFAIAGPPAMADLNHSNPRFLEPLNPFIITIQAGCRGLAI